MCIPNDLDELERIKWMNRSLDLVYNALENPKPRTDLCPSCGRSKLDPCSLCSDGADEDRKRAYERIHPHREEWV